MFSVITACLYFITRAWPLSHVLGHHHMYIVNFYTNTHGIKINGAICGSAHATVLYTYMARCSVYAHVCVHFIYAHVRGCIFDT